MSHTRSFLDVPLDFPFLRAYFLDDSHVFVSFLDVSHEFPRAAAHVNTFLLNIFSGK